MSFTSAASGLKLFDDLNVQLQPGMLYSVYTIGYNGSDAKRHVVIIPDGLYPKSPA